MKGNGIYFLNLPERGSQSWEDIRRSGCISTAGCPRTLDAISEFVPGDTIAAYLPGRGYVGVGVVLNGATAGCEARRLHRTGALAAGGGPQ